MEKTIPREMLIGALADATDVGVETPRFYEREGLLPEPPILEVLEDHESDE